MRSVNLLMNSMTRRIRVATQEPVHCIVKLLSERNPPIEWNFRADFYHPSNIAVTEIIKSAIRNQEHVDANNSKDLHVIIMTYFRSLRVQWNRRQRGLDVECKTKQRKRQRLINKRNRRRASLMTLYSSRIAGFDPVDMEKVKTSLFNMSYMSSEESDDPDDGNPVSFPRRLTIHPLPWRSDFLNNWYDRLDGQGVQKQGVQKQVAWGGMSKRDRKIGSNSDRPPPETAYPWAIRGPERTT